MKQCTKPASKILDIAYISDEKVSKTLGSIDESEEQSTEANYGHHKSTRVHRGQQ